ncbi:hypothetical protein [Clostridium algidicarnis]|uniref:hypothetical protein n=1 Tax=Clostridium algidicarnis TaxID=37659 RepID=UPI001C0AB89E|nr:hypothetical protein [Clostridium algidicarnis]MBU3192627.1 hypothetical protein [Clostridium algidicarnis]
MRKGLIATVIMVLSLTLILMGCSNNVVKRYIEQANTSIENKEYDKALLSLELALNEKGDNSEAKRLYGIVANHQKAKKVIEENNLDEAKKILSEIDAEYTNYSIKEDIDSLKVQIDEKEKEVQVINNDITNLNNLIEEKMYDEAKSLIDELNKKSLNENQNNKINEAKDRIDSELAKIEEQRIAEEEKQKKEEKSKTVSKKYYIPALERSLTKDEMFSEYNKTSRPLDYVEPDDGETYMFNPGGVKASDYK